MPLITGRREVLDIYADAAEKGWVIPAFGTENLTTTEAILAAAAEYGREVGIEDIPVTIAITNQYSHRSQSVNYTHTKRWDIGLRLFQADIDVLTGGSSPFAKLKVMTHLDHSQWDSDAPLFSWDLRSFSMIMYDASNLPFSKNIEKTADFVRKNKDRIVIEGACDEIVDAGGAEQSVLASPERAEEYFAKTGVDLIVVNLGTEHRASNTDLEYHGDLARKISSIVGPKLVLHGTSSVGPDQIEKLFSDGICKVNVWTSLERDSSPVLFKDMLRNTAKIVGRHKAEQLFEEDLLGPKADRESLPSLSHFTTVYRQDIVFNAMKNIVLEYLRLWYRTGEKS